MKTIPRISSVMTPFPWSIERNAPLREARERMAEHDIRHLPVIDGGEIVGVITDRDIHRTTDVGTGDRDLKVADVRFGETYLADLTEPLDRVLMVMASRHLDAIAVVKGGRLAGIFTWSDACRSYAQHLRKFAPPGPGDEVA